jgi:hypothetical protein
MFDPAVKTPCTVTDELFVRVCPLGILKFVEVDMTSADPFPNVIVETFWNVVVDTLVKVVVAPMDRKFEVVFIVSVAVPIKIPPPFNWTDSNGSPGVPEPPPVAEIETPDEV